MKKTGPRRIIGTPGRLGTLCALALLVACFVLPEELYGYRTPYFLSGFIIAGCLLWAVFRIVSGKNRAE